MDRVTTKLKNLRKSAVPRLTVRAMADKLEMPLGSYARYESSSDYKKPFLPLDFTRKIAAVLAQHRVDPATVMQLAGLTNDESEPEARAIEAARPVVQYVTLPIAISVAVPVALPSEAALADMFEGLLALVPADANRAEAARILAQRLPSGFAAIGPVVFDPGTDDSPEAEAVARSPATDRRAPAPR